MYAREHNPDTRPQTLHAPLRTGAAPCLRRLHGEAVFAALQLISVATALLALRRSRWGLPTLLLVAAYLQALLALA